MQRKRTFLTKEGREKIIGELEQLKGEKRRQIAKDLAEARAHGDLSENAEYDAAKEAQAMNEKKISQLEETLAGARMVDENAIAKDQALVGATVKVSDMDTDDEYEYILVAEEESDLDTGRISIDSPVGQALLGHKVGEEVEVKVPAGTITYKILEISR